ncbi:MAG: hypothetical protein A3I44_05370 [Candidatus Sungbacteria bacterium RIFCSPLOWO2_02_FULL_51_17]|uniref:RnfABCDGE type electron transport complex subunit D n=1 Tax=Candidatus Sungbacteria bacterium RIFCSPHIGHO2_02_FULL_51_29 TaxID=1802273 RepID=A0A1G2KQG7_9BACT|nr:MAG: hypothetical protein A2676_01085 [Candidatus Sungbacteria bacterium RIFCSPHIGHO2_01_FULL_51_22]OHA01666.1 MAG: hypothetical protein A3C16_04420 [Candidatus Sungbacteria bacterium RIFCSPHIGHO2_02_FULL_51_29]OHA04538.1 MAG: hypothetical protein A3B29_00035 [Candidatus Sungbacteria bacterium RIFCSPLOWO2_01_FULL_51_34]OHA10546.1 MAG: hypothetical protein A3I44_05370 [Candidatus Sungbacteria bacterium RIFCSPLOWO2_02_FULL_51_17]
MFSSLKRYIRIKHCTVVYLGGLFIFSSWFLEDYERLWRGLLIVGFYVLFDLLWTYIRDRIWYVPISSVISGLVIAVISMPAPSLLLIAALPLIAVFSKQVLHLGKNRLVFNPAAFAIAVAGLFAPSVSWWGVTWGHIPLSIAIIAGLIIIWRQNRWHVAASFLVAYAFFLKILFLMSGVGIFDLFSKLRPQIIDGTLMFFMTVMLIEPLTSAFPTKRQQIIYGVLVGFFAVAVTYAGQLFGWSDTDPLIWGLLIGNITAALLFLPTVRRM